MSIIFSRSDLTMAGHRIEAKIEGEPCTIFVEDSQQNKVTAFKCGVAGVDDEGIQKVDTKKLQEEYGVFMQEANRNLEALRAAVEKNAPTITTTSYGRAAYWNTTDGPNTIYGTCGLTAHDTCDNDLHVAIHPSRDSQAFYMPIVDLYDITGDAKPELREAMNQSIQRGAQAGKQKTDGQK